MSSNANSDNCSLSSLDLNGSGNNNSSTSNLLDKASLEATSQQNFKHEKLLQDYVKLRSKLTIVKKAYVDLSEVSAQKDQAIRKREQEADALNFRNQQLTARVESLQRELELLSTVNATVTTAPTATASNSSSSILSDELQLKIAENASLHRQLNELEVEFRLKLAKNEQTLKQAESDKLVAEKRLSLAELGAKSAVEKLQNDKIKLELSVIQLEEQLRASQRHELKRENKEQTQVELRSSSSSSSSLLSLAEAARPEETLVAQLRTLVECLSRIYGCVDEKQKQNGSESNTKSAAIGINFILFQLCRLHN